MSVDLLMLFKDILFRKSQKKQLLLTNSTIKYWKQEPYIQKIQKENLDYLNKKTRELIEAQRDKGKNNKLIIKNEFNESFPTNINYNFYNGIVVGFMFGFGISKFIYK
jgi:SAM-dependent MidA family methyltransferase